MCVLSQKMYTPSTVLTDQESSRRIFLARDFLWEKRSICQTEVRERKKIGCELRWRGDQDLEEEKEWERLKCSAC